MAAGNNILTIMATWLFSAWPTRERERREGNSTRLAELQRRLRIAINECLLDCGLVRTLKFDEPA